MAFNNTLLGLNNLKELNNMYTALVNNDFKIYDFFDNTEISLTMDYIEEELNAIAYDNDDKRKIDSIFQT